MERKQIEVNLKDTMHYYKTVLGTIDIRTIKFLLSVEIMAKQTKSKKRLQNWNT